MSDGDLTSDAKAFSERPTLAHRRPTMEDVAKTAGVSLSTVSRVVNNNVDVRADLAAQVRDAVALLGYRRDVTASTLRRADRQSASLGLIFEDVSNPFFSAVHRGIEEVARTRGVLTFAASSDDEGERERELAGALCARRVDGLVIAPVGDDHGYLRADRDAGIAMVFIDRPPGFIDADVVMIDNAAAAATATAALVARGHRRIAFLGDRERVITARERRAGYQDVLRSHGIAVDPSLIQLGLVAPAEAAAFVERLLALDEPPTALLGSQNLVTIGAIRALQAQGRQHEIALIGIDDLVLADALAPGLSVVAQDPAAIGRVAAEILFERLEGDRSPTRRVEIPTRLIERGSGEIAPAAHRAR